LQDQRKHTRFTTKISLVLHRLGNQKCNFRIPEKTRMPKKEKPRYSFFLLKTAILAGFDLTTHNSAGGDDPFDLTNPPGRLNIR
jgi:hypothetical protein